jgi:hypothetical protein
MYAVLGHKHTGTTCLSECLINAGVSFGSNCNPRKEDWRLHQLYGPWIDKVQWGKQQQCIQSNILETLDAGLYGLKHPYLAVTLDHWQMIDKPLVIIRSPYSWIDRVKGDVERGTQLWKLVYEPLSWLECPMIDFESDTLIDDITKAFKWYQLVYQGGVEEIRRHPRKDYTIPAEVSQTWKRLCYGINRTRDSA